MKHTSATITSHHNADLKITIPAVRADCGHLHGLFAVVLPSANHDLESFQHPTEEEKTLTEQYFKDLAKHLYANMSGSDLDNLRRSLNALPAIFN